MAELSVLHLILWLEHAKGLQHAHDHEKHLRCHGQRFEALLLTAFPTQAHELAHAVVDAAAGNDSAHCQPVEHQPAEHQPLDWLHSNQVTDLTSKYPMKTMNPMSSMNPRKSAIAKCHHLQLAEPPIPDMAWSWKQLTHGRHFSASSSKPWNHDHGFVPTTSLNVVS